jgi:hypothetical protein
MTDPSESGEPLDQNQTPLDAEVPRGDRRFLTKRLWGCANEPPYFHHGLFTTMRQAVLAHAGKALATRRAFEKLNEYDQTPHLVVDEKFQPKKWPPSREGRSANQGKGEDH